MSNSTKSGLERPCQLWPPRLLDLYPIGSFLWVHKKTLVYKVLIIKKDQVQQLIRANCVTIRTTPGIFQQVRNSVRRSKAALRPEHAPGFSARHWKTPL